MVKVSVTVSAGCAAGNWIGSNMKNIILAATLLLAQPLHAATSANIDLDLTFDREFFQTVYDEEAADTFDFVYDGAPYGFSGPFSGFQSGNSTTVSFTLTDDGGTFSVSNCVFAGLDCNMEFAELKPDGSRLSIWGFEENSFSFDFLKGTALYYQDGPGVRTVKGSYEFYGAEFLIASPSNQELLVVPLPASGLLLMAGLLAAGFGARRFRRS